MSNVIPEPFVPEHLERFSIREHERELINLDNLLVSAQSGYCWAMVIDGDVMCLLGFTVLWKGVAEVYIVPSTDLPKHPVHVIRALRKYMAIIEEQFMLRRLHTFSKEDDQTDKWMRLLGFQCEGVLVGYTANADNYRIWARIK